MPNRSKTNLRSGRVPRVTAPRAGIYEMAGTLHGCDCLIAFDDDGEFTLRTIEPGTDGEAERRQLTDWLIEHGVCPEFTGPTLLLA